MSSKWQSLGHRITQLNMPVLLLVIGLTLFGVAMMVSAGGGHWQPWAGKQLLRGGLGLVLMVAIALVPSRVLLRAAYPVYGAGVGMLLVVGAIGFLGKGAQRWVEVGGVSLQPSEMMKLCVILALARFYHYAPPESTNRPVRLIAALGIIGLPAGMILLQPNLGTATILTLIGIAMIFAMGLSWKIIVPVVLLGLASLPVGWHFLHDYQKQRVETFLHPESDPLGAGYNITQSMIAIGSGGFAGKGYLQGSQGQLDFLPEKHTDFIFTMVAEEFGFVGGVSLLAAFVALIALALGIAARTRPVFSSLIAVGIAAMVFVHMAINVAMVMGLIPVVGVPLPLISYGGSIQLTALAGMGLLLNSYVWRDATLRRTSGGL